jgi:hypothetical protein
MHHLQQICNRYAYYVVTSVLTNGDAKKFSVADRRDSISTKQGPLRRKERSQHKRMTSPDSEAPQTQLGTMASESTLTPSEDASMNGKETPLVAADATTRLQVVSEPEDAGQDHDGASDAHVSDEENDGNDSRLIL